MNNIILGAFIVLGTIIIIQTLYMIKLQNKHYTAAAGVASDKIHERDKLNEKIGELNFKLATLQRGFEKANSEIKEKQRIIQEYSIKNAKLEQASKPKNKKRGE